MTISRAGVAILIVFALAIGLLLATWISDLAATITGLILVGVGWVLFLLDVTHARR